MLCIKKDNISNLIVQGTINNLPMITRGATDTHTGLRIFVDVCQQVFISKRSMQDPLPKNVERSFFHTKIGLVVLLWFKSNTPL